jgi:predicted acyltransferase
LVNQIVVTNDSLALRNIQHKSWKHVKNAHLFFLKLLQIVSVSLQFEFTNTIKSG